MLKSLKNPLIIIFIVVLGVVIVLCLAINLWFNNFGATGYNIEKFEAYREDFEMVAKFCQKQVMQDNLEKERIIFVYNFQKKELLCDWNVIETSESIKKSFENIKKAFPDKDAQFDSITVDKYNVYFVTHNGLYSVVYSEEENPEYLDGVNKGTSKKIDDNWYYIVKK